MKIGTLNYHNAYNYGAVFQAAALQNIIESLGHDCHIIDYKNESVEEQYKYKPLTLNRSFLSNLRANIVIMPFIRKKKQNFEKWFRSYKATGRVQKDELASLADDFDKIVVGSDQVWNMKCQGEDLSFLLNFAPNEKKIAYAASFGTYDINPKYESVFQYCLSGFKAISTREERGTEIVKQLTGKETPCVMDPVLLIGREFWEKCMADSVINEEYIFVYQLGHGTEIPVFTKLLAKELKLPMVFVTAHIGNIVKYRFKDKNKSTASPEEFLRLLANSKYVVTNSFHATALALLFKKQFNVVVKGDGKATYNTRIYSLLERYSLENRITERFENADIGDVDYKRFDEKIEADRENSIDFLKSAL